MVGTYGASQCKKCVGVKNKNDIIIDMAQVSYFALNQPYVINTVIFFGTFLIVVGWMHIHLHASIMNDMGATCDDPIAKFFNKRLADRCYVNTISRSATWVDNNLDKIISTIEKKQNDANARILGLYKMYDDKNKANAAARVQHIANKNQAINDLQKVVGDIKTGIEDNEQNVAKFINDYRDIVKENVGNLKTLAIEIVDKLKRNIYTKNYKRQRKMYINSYDKIKKYMKKLDRDRFFETSIGSGGLSSELPEIPTEARRGKV